MQHDNVCAPQVITVWNKGQGVNSFYQLQLNSNHQQALHVGPLRVSLARPPAYSDTRLYTRLSVSLPNCSRPRGERPRLWGGLHKLGREGFSYVHASTLPQKGRCNTQRVLWAASRGTGDTPPLRPGNHTCHAYAPSAHNTLPRVSDKVTETKGRDT